MNRFNLTFSGEILQGEQPDAVRLRFAKKFAIDDPDRLERFFSGTEVILRRNLDRKEAAECFQEMRQIGVVAELVKIPAEEEASEDTAGTEDDSTPSKKGPGSAAKPAQRKKTPGQKPGKKTRKAPGKAPRKAAASAAGTGSPKQEPEAPDTATSAEAKERYDQLAREAAAARDAAALEKARAEEAERMREQEARRRADAEAARLRAEKERDAAAAEAEQREQARLEAQAEAQRCAEQAAEARRQVEETLKLVDTEKQRADEQQRRAADLARQNTALETKRREAAERAAALEAALQESADRAQREAKQLKARAEKRLNREKERMAKEEARKARASATHEAKLEKERREAEARAAKRESALAEKARQAEQRLQEAQASERRALDAAKRARAEAREQLLLEEHARALEEQAVGRAADALSGGVGLGPARASTRTSLDVPQRRGADPSARKRQPGEPNFYTLKPFRNTKAVRERATQAGHAARRLASMGALAVAALAALTGAFLNYAPPPAIGKVSAVAVTPAGGPVLLAGDRLFLHDRSGAPEAELAFADLGVTQLYPPLAFEAGGAMLAPGITGAGSTPQMLRCDLTGDGCAPLPDLPASVEVTAYASNPVNGELFMLDTGGGLLKTSSTGEVLARAEITLPERPALRLHTGLLFLNSSSGPALSVLRYDDSAFGQQLDEILLVPAAAVAAEHSRVGDFLFSGGNWWITLYNPDTGSAGLYRFDSQWNYLDQAALGHPSLPLALTNWGDKTLVNDGRSTALGRFNAGGGVEVPLTSRPLESLADDSRLRTRLLDAAWRVGLVALALAALLAFVGAYLQRLRHLVYRGARERGAEPVDDLLDDVEWIDASQGRERALRTRVVSYAGIALALLLIAVGQRVGAIELAALLLFLLGPGVALAIVARSSAGHIGVTGERLLLVEPAGTYHLGGGANLLYRGKLLFIDDVALYTGSRLLPAFSEDDITRRVEPLIEEGVRIDARTALTRLLQSHHPLARGLTTIAVCTVSALALLAVGGIF